MYYWHCLFLNLAAYKVYLTIFKMHGKGQTNPNLFDGLTYARELIGYLLCFTCNRYLPTIERYLVSKGPGHNTHQYGTNYNDQPHHIEESFEN